MNYNQSVLKSTSGGPLAHIEQEQGSDQKFHNQVKKVNEKSGAK